MINNTTFWKEINKSGRNLFYVQVINYTMPTLEKTNFDSDDLYENQFTFKKLFYSLLGIQLDNGTSVFGKEIAYMGATNRGIDSGGEKSNFQKLIDSFVLKDNDISTNESANNNQTNVPQGSDVSANINIFDEKYKMKTAHSKPQVLIYHSHTAESFVPYGPSNTDITKSVAAVGEELAQELRKYGVNVISDKTAHDTNYLKSYTRSGETFDNYLKQYGDFDLIIDLHRDSVENKAVLTANINGNNVAKTMFVMANKNPHYSKNIAVANSLINISNRIFPGLMRNTYEYETGTRYFNQNKSNNAVLIEVGSHMNTLGEAKNSGRCLARIIAEYLSSKGE
ncbi:MAG: stage II sporulation protein P [Clostridiaceae bacterium]